MNWFEQLSTREKNIVLAASLVLSFLLIFLMVIEPIQKGNIAAKDRLAAEKVLLEYMSKSAKLLVKQGSLAPTQQFNNSTTPYILVDQNIKRLGLHLPDRMTPQGQKSISFRYKMVSFDQLIKLVQQLQNSGLQLVQMTTTKISIGMVSARIKMEKP